MIKVFFSKKKKKKKKNICVFKGRTTPNHYAFSVMFIVPVEKQMNFAHFGGPVEIFVRILVPSCHLKKSLKPL